jgi:DNA mismatch endonuclease (patch repair protein)
MVDKLTVDRRRRNMAAIRSVHTKPEMTVRRLVYSLGYRYRLHCKDLPGKPDLVFRSRRRVIFVHGCFWHLHPSAACADARRPKSNKSYWNPKLQRNVERDREHLVRLRSSGWRVLVIWECETRDFENIATRVMKFLGPV